MAPWQIFESSRSVYYIWMCLLSTYSFTDWNQFSTLQIEFAASKTNETRFCLYINKARPCSLLSRKKPKIVVYFWGRCIVRQICNSKWQIMSKQKQMKRFHKFKAYSIIIIWVCFVCNKKITNNADAKFMKHKRW